MTEKARCSSPWDPEILLNWDLVSVILLMEEIHQMSNPSWCIAVFTSKLGSLQKGQGCMPAKDHNPEACSKLLSFMQKIWKNDRDRNEYSILLV